MPALIALAGLLLNTIVAATMAETFDEGPHVRYGAAVLRGSADRSSATFDSKMPVTALNALPRVAGRFLENRGIGLRFRDTSRSFRTARIATVGVAFCLSLLVYVYAASLFGRPAGIGAQLLFTLSPNIIAHSTLATTDLYCAFATVLVLFLLRRFLLSPGTANAFFLAAALGCAQLTKFLAAYLYIAVAVILVGVALCAKYGGEMPRRFSRRHLVLLLALSALCFLVCVNAGFLFDRTLTPLARYEFRSATFKDLQQVPLLNRIPLPVPYPYLQGFDWMRYHDATGASFGNIVLLGDVRGELLPRSDGFFSYYIVAYLLKEPLGMQLLLVFGLAWVIRHRRPVDTLSGEWPLLAAAAVVFCMLSFFSDTQIGIRHALPVLVILVILSGAAFASWAMFSWGRRALLAACVLYVAISVGSYFPHMIPYFNEIVADRKMAYQYLADSNLDWGQNATVVADYLRVHPNVALEPPDPRGGWVLVSANRMAGVSPSTADYWVRGLALEPAAHVGYAHLLFWVPMEKLTSGLPGGYPGPDQTRARMHQHADDLSTE